MRRRRIRRAALSSIPSGRCRAVCASSSPRPALGCGCAGIGAFTSSSPGGDRRASSGGHSREKACAVSGGHPTARRSPLPPGRASSSSGATARSCGESARRERLSFGMGASFVSRPDGIYLLGPRWRRLASRQDIERWLASRPPDTYRKRRSAGLYPRERPRRSRRESQLRPAYQSHFAKVAWATDGKRALLDNGTIVTRGGRATRRISVATGDLVFQVQWEPLLKPQTRSVPDRQHE
jgi:hypothetical protein